MIAGLGIDLVEIRRVERAHKRFGEHFCRKFLTESEMRDPASGKPQFLAGRFAAKEAAVKALGTGFSRGVSARQIETFSRADGKPGLRFFGEAAKTAAALKVKSASLSISHEKNMAVAIVILEA